MAIPAQEWPLRPGPRTVEVGVFYPQGKLESVGSQTGLMLSLHNWGGTRSSGTASPQRLADQLDVVALTVDYLQSGRHDSMEAPEAYDFGYLQALDALRALYFVYHELQTQQRPFARGRIYATGGSGGGNVSLMANKLAPRMFACVVDMCGMKKLSNDVAYNLPGGSATNARYSRDPDSPNHLSPDHQELRFVGHPDHLQAMRRMGAQAKIVIVHGIDDYTFPDAAELARNLRLAGLNVEPRYIGPAEVDGKIFTNTGHGLGDRTQIVFEVAGKYLRPDSPELLVREGPSNFDLPDQAVRYETRGGAFIISYELGYPVGRFEPSSR